MPNLRSQSPTAAKNWVERYLDLLQVERAEPSLAALARLTLAHVRTVPFENITSVLRREAQGAGPVAPLNHEAILQSWEERRAGGVCFEVVAMFDHLLASLGYRTHPVPAQISFPGSHQANFIELESVKYLVDVGNGSPFPEPIALDTTVEVRNAGLAYRFRPDTAPGAWIQDRCIDEAWVPFCHYLLVPLDPVVRESAYQRHHTPGLSWVVDSLVLVLATEEEVWSLRGDELRHFTPEGRTVEHVSAVSEYARLAAKVFGLPGLPIDSARAALARRKLGS